MTLKQEITSLFNIDYAISGGAGNSQDNAVIIHRVEPNDYASVEYGVLKCISEMRNTKMNIISQALLTIDDRNLDKITVETIFVRGDQIIKQRENYYFDITECF